MLVRETGVSQYWDVDKTYGGVPVLAMHADQLLRALKEDAIHMWPFRNADLSRCRVFVVKDASLGDAKQPSREHEVGDNAVEMQPGETLGAVAARVGRSGAPLFVHVLVGELMQLQWVLAAAGGSGLPSPREAPTHTPTSAPTHPP